MPHNSIRTLCIIAVSFFACWLLHDLRSIPLSIDRNLNSSSQAIVGAANGILPTLAKVNTGVDGLSGIVADERKAQTVQSRELSKILAASKEVLVRTDCNLNGGPGCLGLLPQTSKSIQTLQKEGLLLLGQTAETVQKTSQTLDSLNRRISDPKIDETLAHFDLMALHLESATAHGDAILASGEHTAVYYDKKLTTPPKLAKTIIMTGLHLITIPLR